MILEIAILNVHDGQQAAYEDAFRQAELIIMASPGYISHELQHSIENPTRYVLLVTWESVTAHEVGFRQSAAYQGWKRLLHGFYESFSVEHYQVVR